MGENKISIIGSIKIAIYIPGTCMANHGMTSDVAVENIQKAIHVTLFAVGSIDLFQARLNPLTSKKPV